MLIWIRAYERTLAGTHTHTHTHTHMITHQAQQYEEAFQSAETVINELAQRICALPEAESTQVRWGEGAKTPASSGREKGSCLKVNNAFSMAPAMRCIEEQRPWARGRTSWEMQERSQSGRNRHYRVLGDT